MTDPWDAEVRAFMREYDEGKHPLSPEDEVALEAARDDFHAKLCVIFALHEQSESVTDTISACQWCNGTGELQQANGYPKECGWCHGTGKPRESNATS